MSSTPETAVSHRTTIQPLRMMIGVQAMDQDQTDWATAYYYVATLWALVGEDFSEEWRHLRESFDRRLSDVPAGHEAGDRLRAVLDALQAQVDEVTATRVRCGASRQYPVALVPVFAQVAVGLAKFARIVENDVRSLPLDTGDEQGHAVEYVRNAVCEFDKVWVSPVLAPAFQDAVEYLGNIDLDAVLWRHGR